MLRCDAFSVSFLPQLLFFRVLPKLLVVVFSTTAVLKNRTRSYVIVQYIYRISVLCGVTPTCCRKTTASRNFFHTLMRTWAKRCVGKTGSEAFLCVRELGYQRARALFGRDRFKMLLTLNLCDCYVCLFFLLQTKVLVRKQRFLLN